MFTQYFSTIFTTNNPSEANFVEVLQCIDPVISEDCNQMLLKPYTKEEVYAALQ